MKIFKLIILLLTMSLLLTACSGGENNEEVIQDVNGTENANPLIPGYFADPSVCKFGDTYYIYATTGGLEFNGGALATPCVWKSRDFVNWSAEEIDLRTSGGSKYTFGSFWAPSVLNHNGKYYMSFTLNDHDTILAESDSPEGPFTVLGNVYAKTDWKNYKTIDSQFFKDDDGKVYIVHLVNTDPSLNSSVTLKTGISELNADDLMKVENSIFAEGLNDMYREGQEIVKKDGKYYMFYSTNTWTGEEYLVRYAVADNIVGPYTDKSAILKSNQDLTVRGPGHSSTLYENGNYYIVYHRHFNPFISFNYRQVCANRLVFKEDGDIEEVVPDHKLGAGRLAEDPKYSGLKNVASGAEITTDINSRSDLKALTDQNNGTLWKCTVEQLPASLIIDLKEEYNIKFTQVFFEYTVKYFRYTLEYSSDGEKWEIYADRKESKEKRMPMEDQSEVSARFFRLTLEKPQTMNGAYQTNNNETGVQTTERDRPYCGIFEFKIFAENK